MQDIESLEASLAICDAKLRFCQSLDGKDWRVCRDLLTQDFSLDVYEQSGIPPITGCDAAIAHIRSRIAHATTTHQQVNGKIRLNGAGADAIFALQVKLVSSPSGVLISGAGDYCEHWVRHGYAWKLTRLKITNWCAEILPILSVSSMVH